MTTSPIADAERKAEFASRFTPQLVDLNSHGGSITITFLLDSQYYTAKRIHPDFINVADDAMLDLVNGDEAVLVANLQARRQMVERWRCIYILVSFKANLIRRQRSRKLPG